MASSTSQGGPQQMPQNPGPSPVMDYNNAGSGQMVQYGYPNRMPQFGNTGPVMDYNNVGPSQNVQYGQGAQQMPNMQMRPGPIMDYNQPGGLGMRLPGFVPGGPDDPANGGSGYYNGGGILNPHQGAAPPRIQNPGILRPENNVPENRIGGGARGEVYNPKPKPKPQGAFQGLSKGTMPSMKKHVQAGKMGKAKQAFEAGGGKWTKDVHKRLKKKYG